MRYPTLLIVLVFLCIPLAGSARGQQWWDGFAPTGFEAPVRSITLLGNQIIVAGDFMTNGTGTTPVLSFYDAGQWQAFAVHPPFVSAVEVAVYQGQVISNGAVPGFADPGPYRWSGSQWDIMGAGLQGGFINRIDASAIYDGKLIVAGGFQASGLLAVNGVAAWDGSSWSALGAGVTGSISDMVAFNGDLYVTGFLQGSGAVPFDNLARWDGSQWQAVEGSFAGSAVIESGLFDSSAGGLATGMAVAIHQGKLAVGGDFLRVGSTAVSNLVLFDPALQEWSVPSGGTAGVVRALESFNGKLVAGGTDTHLLGGKTVSLAAWDGASWTELGTSPEGTVYDLLTDVNLLYVAGDFPVAGGLRCGGFIAWNGTTYQILQNASGAGVDGDVDDLGEYQGKLLVGGSFTHGGNTRLNNIGLWEDGWSALAGGTNGRVYRTLVDGTDLYVAGDFTEAGGSPSSHVARYDGLQWQSYGTTLPDGAESIALFGGDLYAGSEIYNNPGFVNGYLYRWSNGAWTEILVDQTVSALAAYNGRLYMGTDIFSGNMTYNLMSSADGMTWAPVVGTGGETGPGQITRLVVIDGALYILGSSLWQWDGTNLVRYGPTGVQTVPPNDGMGIGPAVFDLLYDGTTAILGSQGEYNGFTVLSWDGIDTKWQNVGLGAWSRVNAVQLYRGELFVGGMVAMVGGQPETGSGFPTVGMASRGLARFFNPPVTAVQAPARFNIALHGADPNPFNPRTQVSFTIPAGGRDIRLKIFDARGRLVRTLLREFRGQGTHVVPWDGRDDAGRAVVSGTYFVNLVSRDEHVSSKMTLVR